MDYQLKLPPPHQKLNIIDYFLHKYFFFFFKISFFLFFLLLLLPMGNENEQRREGAQNDSNYFGAGRANDF
jgi:hypothetical protein